MDRTRSLTLHDEHDAIIEHAKLAMAPLTIDPVIGKRECRLPFEAGEIREVDVMRGAVRLSLALVPFELHRHRIVSP